MHFFGVVDGVLGYLHHHVVLGQEGLTTQARVGLQTPSAVQKVFFVFSSSIKFKSSRALLVALNGCDKFILLVRNNLFAPHYHVDKVVSHIEDRVSAVDQSVLMVKEALEVVQR